MSEKNDAILCLLTKKPLTIGPTTGTECPSQSQFSGVFSGWVEENLEGWGVAVGKSSPTGKVKVNVYKLTEDAHLSEVFESVSHNIDSLCLTWGQINNFVRDHRSWLRADECITLFLTKGEESDNYFVVIVYHDDDCLIADVDYFWASGIWYAEDQHWVVIPQPVGA